MRLTAAARKVLDDHLDQLRGRVIREASRGARGAAGTAGTAETRSAIARVALADRVLPHSVFDLLSLLSRPPYAFAFLGATLAVAVVAAGAVTATAGLSLTPVGGALLGALLGVAATVGVAVALGFAGTRMKTARIARREVVAEFLGRMSELEGLATAASGHRLSLRKAVEAVWAKEDVLVFGRLLRLRNALLHEDAPPPTQAELLAMLLEVDRLAAALTRGDA